MRMIRLQSSDGEIFDTEEEIAKCSGTIKIMLENCSINESDDAIVPLSNLEDNENNDEKTSDISLWDANFLNVDQSTLFGLILAANYLDIKGILELTYNAVANMIKGKTPEEIRKTFNIRNDLNLMKRKSITNITNGAGKSEDAHKNE